MRPDPTTAPPSTAPAPAAQASALRRALPRIVGGVVLAVLVASALALFADVRSLGNALERFHWWLLLPVIGLTLANYALRWGKWHVYLRVVDVPRIPIGESVLAFLSAFSMSLTPGKVGEIIKAVHVHRLTRSPVSRIAAIIAAERITDGLAMIALAGIGLLQFDQGRPIMAAAAVLGIGAVLLLRHPTALRVLTGRLAGVPMVGPLLTTVAHHVEGFLDASNRLYAPGLLAGSVAVGVVSWFCECLALYLILTGLGLDPSWHLLLVSTFVLSVSSVLGALSMLPGGLGVAEASVAGLLLLLVDDPAFARADAAAATLLIRFGTLWFGVLLGIVALVILQRRGRRHDIRPDRPPKEPS